MYQGETLTITISNLPVPVSEIDCLHVVFKNAKGLVLEKVLRDCIIDGEVVSINITQLESLALPVGGITFSIILVTKSGARIESDPSSLSVKKTYKEVLLPDGYSVEEGV